MKTKHHCCRLFAVLQDSLFNSQCLSILQFKLISIHASKSARLFHFYISRINSVIYRMIRWKKEKPKYPGEKFTQRMKKTLRKKTTYTSVNLRVFVSKSEFFCSWPLLAQNWIFKYSARMQNTLRESKGRVAVGNADLIYNNHLGLSEA